MIALTATTAALPLGGKFLEQILDKGPVVIVLVAILIVGYRRYNKVADGFIKTSEGFMMAQESRMNAIERGIKRIGAKLGVDEDF